MSRQPVYEYHADRIEIPLEYPKVDKTSIIIESGYAFGTGEHYTTKLCLQMIQNIFSDRVISNVLDVGCGSAILSIASVALGAGGAMSIDIEPSVIGEARKNIETNDYSSKIQVQNCDIDHIKGSYDLVIANILTEQILKISKKLADRMNVNGQLILSGIRLKEKDIIIDKFTELNTVFKKSLTDGDWCSLLFSKI